MKLKFRTVIMLLIAGLAVAGLFYMTFRTDPVPVSLHTIARGDMRVTIDADGKTRIRDVFEVAAPISGMAGRSPVAVGDAVIKGKTVVAVVEPVAPSLLDRRSRLQAEAAVREAEAALKVAQSDLAKAGEELAYAESQYDRIKTLANRGVSSLTQLEDAAQRLSIATATHHAAQSRIEMAQGTLERTNAALVEPDQTQDDTGACCVPLTAPADGVVLEVDMISERPVAAGTRLLSIGDPTRLEIVADLLSTDAVRVGPGAKAIVERWGGDGSLSAVLRKIEPTARTKVSALGIEEQRVDVVFDLETPLEDRAQLGDGFSVYLRIIEWRAEDVLQIPQSAAFRQGDDWMVYVVTDGIATTRQIQLGRRNGRNAELLGGLEAGAQVVLHPSEDLADGVEVVDRDAL